MDADEADVLSSNSSDSSSDESDRPLMHRTKLTFNRKSARAVATANRELAQLASQQALQMYTEALKLYPGHPVAFVNRSLCYLVLGYPHLAVTDAHRALLAAKAIKSELPDDFNGRNNLYSLHLYTGNADSAIDVWKEEPGCYVAQGTFGFLDVELASLCIRPIVRGEVDDGVTSLQKVQEYLRRDLAIKAYYRLALGLWKCGGGAWQSAMDQICEAKTHISFNGEDEWQFEALHNQILLEIEDAMEEEDEIRKYLKVKMGWAHHLLQKHENAGIRGLLKSRHTKIKREQYPWDSYSITWQHEPRKALEGLNNELTKARCSLQYQIATQDNSDKPPMLLFVANKRFEGSEIMLSERTALNVVCPDNHASFCGTCGAFLDVPTQLHTEATKTAGESSRKSSSDALVASRPQSPVTRSGSNEKPTRTARRDRTTGAEEGKGDTTIGYGGKRCATEDGSSAMEVDPLEPPASTLSQEHDGYQLCPCCRKEAFCSLRCSTRAIPHGYHFYVCNIKPYQHIYDIHPPNTWRVPSLIYGKLLDLLVHRTIAVSMGAGPVLTQHWVKVMDGGYSNPRNLPHDEEMGEEGLIWLWDESKSVPLETLYPHRLKLGEIIKTFEEQKRRDSEANDLLSHTICEKSEALRNEPLMPSEQTKTYIASLQKEHGESTQGIAIVTEKDLKLFQLLERSSSDDTLPDESASPMIDWSYESNVCLPIQLLFDIFGRKSGKQGFLAMLDVQTYDGWMLETLRAKVDAGMRIQQLPKQVVNFDVNDNRIEAREFERKVEKDARYGLPLFGSNDSNWMASLGPLFTALRQAKDGETPNVEVLDMEGALYIRALRRIEPGEVLLRKPD